MNDPDKTVVFENGGEESATGDAAALPTHIGRYRVEKVLGQGGFGLVYLAYDGQLSRPVAIKVPHRKLVDRPVDAEAYLAEARTVANLDHPHIVTVFDVGSTEHFPCFVVSKYIDGSDLATRLKQSRLPLQEAAELVATVAEALHFAHKQGLVHRDIKPGNLLLDKFGKPFVADFGLALRDHDVGKGPRYCGTPAYMSPEQARGEGHRVDGRTDIFSLGVVLYELLVGRRPFKADSQAELLEQIANFEPRPPRQHDDHIPKELERICLKALSKRASERYSTAKDFAGDLCHFLNDFPLACKSTVTNQHRNETEVTTPTPIQSSASDNEPVKIIPKGLRSFDAHDADFFLELLPGPRDREGLPDSIRFWKTRIEETDADNTFSVGLIYGPSGCGKSSLMKAGLLPRLSLHVIAVYVEATAEETETRLLNGLRKRCPSLPDNLPLTETLGVLRRGQSIPVGNKVLIVLDQFEQWLHAKKEADTTELVQALRQCDGVRVQCVVMVRDDFWLSVSRFLRGLEVRLVEGQNSALVDLFDLDHSKKVLAAFGRAFGKLPENPGDQIKDQKQFVEQAASGLAQEGKVISVRLALFAEMMKGKVWIPATLKKVGGVEGVGVTFLEETFSAATAPPEHRYHQKAAREVLKALLPESGTDIKGHMRSYAELLEASSDGNRPKEFDDLIRILDNEIRLITPTDPEGQQENFTTTSKVGEEYYQLTHDYLVPSLREWLTRKQKETRRGRAELLLVDLAGVWNARPENRQLPSLWQWIQIRWLTVKKSWTAPQRKLMQKAMKYHAVRGLVLALLVAMTMLTGLAIREQVVEQRNATHAAGLVQRVLDAETAQVPAIVTEISGYRKWTDPLLRQEHDKAAANSRQKLHASLALLPVEPAQGNSLYSRLLDAEPHEVQVIRDALTPHKDTLLDKLWSVAERPEKDKESQRLRAAAALAKYAPATERWAKVQVDVSNDLVNVPAVYLVAWMDSLRPVRVKLLSALSDVYQNVSRTDVERTLASNILADYAADQPQVLADLIMDADEKQFAVIYPKFKIQAEGGLPFLTGEIDKRMPPELPSSDENREKLAKRQANAAVTLLRMMQPEIVWPLLKHSPDPRVRSYLIHRLGRLGIDANVIAERLDDEPDITIRRALILSFGEFDDQAFSLDDRKALLPKIRKMYQTDADPGLHAASEWLLRIWKQEAWLKSVNNEWAKDREGRETKIDGIKDLVTKDKKQALHQWYVNSQGQTMVVIPGPVEFLMGSPTTEVGRIDDEVQHTRRIKRTFAIASKPVTLEQYRHFAKGHSGSADLIRAGDLPVVGINWYMAAAYCNWLSKEEGIPEDQWCYEIEGDVARIYEIKGVVVKLKEKYLSLAGYRLPTEAEMEYATRAGTLTSRYFGETDELLAKYAWYSKNSSEKPWPVGSLKPNDFGLFDMQGNAFTWCQESYKPYPVGKGDETADDQEDKSVINSTRILRGGSFSKRTSDIRSSYRLSYLPTNPSSTYGFRLTKTFSLVPITTLPPTP